MSDKHKTNKDFQGLVWYWIKKDKIFQSGYLDAMFFALVKLDWDEFEVLGEL